MTIGGVFDGSRSRALAAEVIALRFEDLGPRDLWQLKRLILDHLGCCYRGSLLPWGRGMREWALTYAGSGRAGLFASDAEASPAIAAFANATAAHGLELDDTHDESVSHPGAAIIATALAVGRQRRAGGRDLLPAISAGYEVTGRLGAASNAAEVIERGFHPTALFTGFGAAATAARLMGLDAVELARAWGLVLSMAGGSMQFSQEPTGTTVKRLHGGYAALHGVIAAEHSALGIAGPEQALDGRYGLVANFGRKQDPDRLLRAHADGPEIHRVSFKPYPCCRLFHSTLDALEEVTDGFRMDPAEIRSIRVGGPEILVSQHMLRRPESEMAAQYSLPFTLGAALHYGPRSVDGFMGQALADPRILAIADGVQSELSPEMEAAFPEHFGSWIELETASGERRRAEVLDSLGTPARPMTNEALCAKFDELTEPVGLGMSGAEVLDRLQGLESPLGVDELLSPFLQGRMAAGTAARKRGGNPQ
jgi:2-methylcitrate dehydratase PrpD